MRIFLRPRYPLIEIGLGIIVLVAILTGLLLVAIGG
jgi:hypothetical protein